MFARVKEDSIITPLVFQTRSRNTPPKPGNSSCTVPLYLMAGTLSAGAPGGTARHIVTVCVSYWSEACQPKNHAIMGLTDTSEQVLARQAKLTVHVDVSRHLRVASVLSQPAFTPGEIAGGDIPSERGGLGDLFVTVQLVRHGTERALLVRLCGLFGPVTTHFVAHVGSALFKATACLMHLSSPVPVIGILSLLYSIAPSIIWHTVTVMLRLVRLLFAGREQQLVTCLHLTCVPSWITCQDSLCMYVLEVAADTCHCLGLLQARLCSKAELATLLSKAPGDAKQTYANVCEHLRCDGSVAVPAEISTCSLHSSLHAFPAVKTFGKAAKPPHTGLRMPPVNEQLQISANHFANAMIVLWALLPGDDPASDAPVGHGELVWGTHVLTKQVNCFISFSSVLHCAQAICNSTWLHSVFVLQMFLEYQSVSGSGLRRMMDAPIVSTSHCHALAGQAPSWESVEINSVCLYPCEVLPHASGLNMKCRKYSMIFSQ